MTQRTTWEPSDFDPENWTWEKLLDELQREERDREQELKERFPIEAGSDSPKKYPDQTVAYVPVTMSDDGKVATARVVAHAPHLPEVFDLVNELRNRFPNLVPSLHHYYSRPLGRPGSDSR